MDAVGESGDDDEEDDDDHGDGDVLLHGCGWGVCLCGVDSGLIAAGRYVSESVFEGWSWDEVVSFGDVLVGIHSTLECN